MSIVQNIIEGWNQAKDLRTDEGFAKNLSLLYDDLDAQEVVAKTIARRNGEQYQSDPIQEWDRRIEAMQTSHDPRIQKMGIDLMDDQYRRETAADASGQPNSYKEYQFATPEAEQSPEGYSEFLNNRSTQRIMNIQDPNAPVPLSQLDGMVDSEGNPMPFPVGTTWQQVKDAGAMVGGAKLTGEEGRRAGQFALAENNLAALEEAMANGADLSGLGGQFKAARSEGGWVGSTLNAVMNAAGYDNMSPADIEAIGLVSAIENTIVAAIRGAAVGPQEIDQFARQLPRAGMPPELFAENLRLTKENLATLKARTDAMRGVGGSSNPLPEKAIRRQMYSSQDTMDQEIAQERQAAVDSAMQSVPASIRRTQSILPPGAVAAPPTVNFGDNN